MNKRQERRYRRRAVANAREFIGCEYTLGGRFLSDPPHGDCRGLWDTGWELTGALLAIGGRHRNVRHMYAKGKQMGCLLPPDAPMRKGDGIIYFEPNGTPTPANPLCIRHTAMCEWPDSPARPGGVAIGATNPTLGVMRHDLALTKLYFADGSVKPSRFGLAILSIFRPNLDLLDQSDEPSEDPEPPIQDQ